MDKYAYAYFNSDGTLREFIIDPSVREGNIGINKILIYWDNEEPFGSFGLSYINTDALEPQWSAPLFVYKRAMDFVIPVIQDYDPKYFEYGKTYSGYVISLPTQVLSQTGNIGLSLYANYNGEHVGYFGLMTLYISETGASFQSEIDHSQYYYLLNQIQENALPELPSEGTWTLKCIDGVLTWVQDE